MGGFENMILVIFDPSVKYHSLEGYTLTFVEKMQGNSIWWVVLVGRYPPKK
jgi:hypothetical protein